MRRTQIYLTDEQEAQVAELASARSVSKAAVIREFIDAGLDNGHEKDREADARAAILTTAGIFRDYPDWPEWLAEVRSPGGLNARLEKLGL